MSESSTLYTESEDETITKPIPGFERYTIS